MLKPSDASVSSHSSISSAIVTGVPTNAWPLVASDTLREFAHGQILSSCQLHDPLASTFARIAFGNCRQWAVRIEARGIMPERDRERRDSAIIVHQAVEPRPLLTRLGS